MARNTMFKPMLACEADLEKLRYPILASPKLDGVRAIVRDGIVYSRSNKPIPNKHVQTLFKPYEHFDGELIVGSPTAHDVYRQTTSGVMSVEGKPSVRFYVFDHVEYPNEKYMARSLRVIGFGRSAVVTLEQNWMQNIDDLLKYEASSLELGYEGLILRNPYAPYKMGRSTMKEGYLLKLKRFTDAEFEVIGFEERMHNGNEATINELGRTKRSSHKDGKIGRGDLGALVLHHPSCGTFNVGTGFTDDERSEVWKNRTAYLGKLAKVKYFAIGMKDAPRHPVFLGWRDKRDT